MIYGDGIILRTVQAADLADLYRHSMDYADAGEFMPVALTSQSDFNAEFQRSGFWQDTSGKLIIANAQQEIVGEIGCFKTAHYLDGREVYYRIYQDHRQKGYAKAALKTFVQFFFESTAFNRLQGVTVEGNDVSAAMLQKCGFMHEGTLRQARWFKGKLVDLHLYALLRQDVLSQQN